MSLRVLINLFFCRVCGLALFSVSFCRVCGLIVPQEDMPFTDLVNIGRKFNYCINLENLLYLPSTFYWKSYYNISTYMSILFTLQWRNGYFFSLVVFFFIAGHMSRYCKYDFTESAMIGLSESHDISHVTSVYIWISPDNESPRIPLQNDSG